MKKSYLALDVGGTKIAGISFSSIEDLLYNIECPISIPTGVAVDNNEQVFKNIVQVIRGVKQSNLVAIGIGLPGVVNSVTKEIINIFNISNLNKYPLVSELSKEFLVPIYIQNDARAFVLAEQKFGTKSLRNILGMIIGTGIGGGIIVDNKLLNGETLNAGEIGHQIINKKTSEEMFAGPGLSYYFKDKIGIENLSEVICCYQNDFTIFNKYIACLVKEFALFCYNLSLNFNPSEIVLGGWVGKNFWSYFQEEIQNELDQYWEKFPTGKSPLIKISQYSNSCLIGAGLIALGL